MTPEQTSMLVVYQWVFPILISVIAFIGALGVKALIDMRKTLNEINTHIAVATVKHDNLEGRVEKVELLEERVLKLEKKR